MVPVRAARFGFAPMLNATVPSPDPLPPDVIDNQDADEDAVHEQPTSVSTLTVLLAAAAGTDVLTGLMANVQVWPLWVTANAWPPIVIVPFREDVPGFAVTL
jgi:hypothetical protein